MRECRAFHGDMYSFFLEALFPFVSEKSKWQIKGKRITLRSGVQSVYQVKGTEDLWDDQKSSWALEEERKQITSAVLPQAFPFTTQVCEVRCIELMKWYELAFRGTDYSEGKRVFQS